MTTPLAACTIVSKNYLPFARVLARSFAEHHPGAPFFVLLVDRVDARFDPAAEPFTVIEVEELDNIPELPSFLFKYTLLELNTAVKPPFLAHLLARHDPATLLYFDPDIWILRPLEELLALLARSSIVLTPHLTAPIDDDAHPSELSILQSGAYNLGFLGLSRGPETDRFLAWWRERLVERCVVRIEAGLFVDQRWVDLVPGLFDGVRVLRDPGHNVAYWNLHGRVVRDGADGATANGRPLVFFHFSGFEPEVPELVSRHQDRFTLADLGEAAALFRRYRERLLAAGYETAHAWPYAFGRFDQGVPIPDAARRLYHALAPRERRRFGDPFAAGGDRSFFAWLNAPAEGSRRRGPYLSRLLAHLWTTRPDLQAIFPRPAGAQLPEFSSWMAGYGRYELGLDPAFLEALHRESRATLWTVDGLRRRLTNRAKRLYHSPLGKWVKDTIKRLLGARRARELKRQLRRGTDGAIAAAATPAERRHRIAPPRRIARPGVNVVGYFTAETGVGESGRSLVRALATTALPHSLHTLESGVVARRADPSVGRRTSAFPFDVNLFVVNADEFPRLREELGEEVFGGRFNVGFWAWELDTFPARWAGAFDLVHEVWSPSSFSADAIAAVSPVPVYRVPNSVDVAPRGVERAAFGLPEGAFVFLFVFNYLSYFERKNPLAVVDAFRRAVGDRDDALLVLKTSQADFAPEAHARLAAAIGDAPVRLIEEYWSREETLGLIEACDAYVSLHRSEGFGLTVAEAMELEKPVIATAYSGNTDFLHVGNGYPVGYELVVLETASGPYPAGARWAEPDVEEAARWMRHVYHDREAARRRGRRARREVLGQVGHAAVGRRMERRVLEIVQALEPHAIGGVR